MKPNVSIIVPVYKVEAYLDRCVQSIIDQKFENFELILVDDGSPDNCGAMCDAWAEKDTRIRVIHKENGGLSDARNVGFEASIGEWITFIDSDDYVHPKMVEALYHAVMEHDVKLSVCGFAYSTGEPLEVADFAAKVWNPEEFYVQHNIKATVAWGKLYHRSIVLRYPKGKLHEDEYVTYRILLSLNKVAVIETALYGYFQNSSGITKSTWTPKRMDVFGAFEEQMTYFRNMRLPLLVSNRRRVYVEALMLQMKSVKSATPRGIFRKEEKWMKKKAKMLLLQGLTNRHFATDSNMWLYAVFFPRATKVYCILQGIGKKIRRR